MPNLMLLSRSERLLQLSAQKAVRPLEKVGSPLTLGMGSIGQNSTFQNMVMLHIKLNGIAKCSNMVANICV